MTMNGEFRAAEQVLRGMKRNDRQAVALQRVLDEVKHQHEDLLMYERWADASPARVIECSCGSRWQVRIADHEIGDAVPAGNSSAPMTSRSRVDADQIERWQAMEERARVIQGGTSETMAGAADYILGEGAGK